MTNAADRVPSLGEFAALVRARRTSMHVDQSRSVPSELVDEIVELAIWAPNHKRTWPWRFAVFTGDGRFRLGEAFATDLGLAGINDEVRLAKTRRKYGRTPSVVAVASAPGDQAMRDDDRDAVAAGLQNFLLGATAVGLASYWSSAPIVHAATVVALCGFEPDTRIIAVVYLGWPDRQGLEAPPRPAIRARHIS